MRLFALTTMMVFLFGLFAAGHVLGAGQEESGSSGTSHKQAGASSQSQGQQQVAAGQLNQEQIRQVQQTLQEKGASPGAIDGIMGPKTKQAIRQFQQDQGIAASGQLDQETLKALDLQEFMGVSPQFGEEQQKSDSKQQQEQQQDRKDQMEQQQPEQQQEKSPSM